MAKVEYIGFEPFTDRLTIRAELVFPTKRTQYNASYKYSDFTNAEAIQQKAIQDVRNQWEKLEPIVEYLANLPSEYDW